MESKGAVSKDVAAAHTDGEVKKEAKDGGKDEVKKETKNTRAKEDGAPIS